MSSTLQNISKLYLNLFSLWGEQFIVMVKITEKIMEITDVYCRSHNYVLMSLLTWITYCLGNIWVIN